MEKSKKEEAKQIIKVWENGYDQGTQYYEGKLSAPDFKMWEDAHDIWKAGWMMGLRVCREILKNRKGSV